MAGSSSSLEAMAERLRAVVGPDGVQRGRDVPERHHADSSRLDPTPPAIVVRPRTTRDVSDILRLCNDARQPVVTQGGLTGLAGGAHPFETEVAISLERMSGIEEVDAVAGTITALAGTPLHVIQEAAKEAGFLCGIDLGARGSCTIGGNVATNAGGNRVLRYGMTRHNVLGLEAVMADGTVVTSMNKMLKNNAGYDWTQLFIGSEGTLGIVTRVVVALHPQPHGLAAAFCTVPDFASIIAIQRALERAVPGGLFAFEGMWRDMMDIATGPCGLRDPFSSSYEAALLIEVDGETRAVEMLETTLGELHEAGTITEALVARSEADRSQFWAYRETPYEYGGRFGTLVSFDVSLPRAVMDRALETIRARVRSVWPDAISAIFGHVADSNVHVLIVRAEETPSARAAIEPLVYGIIGQFGGSVSAEHGIGVKKREYLGLSRSSAEIALMTRLKSTLDPGGILNRDRVFAWNP